MSADLNDLQAFVVAGAAGDYLFRQGDDGAELFLLRQGQVELIDDPGGARVMVLKAGDVFGERQLFAPGPRTVSARGVTEFQAFRIDRETLSAMASEDINVAIGFIERLAMRAPAAPPPAVPAPADEAAEPEPAGPPSGTPCLTVSKAGASFPLSGSAELVVGRPDRASGFAPDIDLSPHDDERSLSRRHAHLLVREGGVFVREEQNARNGTFVNGTRVEAGVEVALAPGTSVRFGLVETVFEYREDM